MRVLIVAATTPEIAPLVARLEGCEAPSSKPIPYQHRDRIVDVLETGVGMVATAVWCSRALTTTSYDLALNIGICGSFDPSLVPGTVVHVISDRLAELGAEDGERFLTVHDLQLLDRDAFPFRDGALVNGNPPAIDSLRGLPVVAGITVNTVHGREESIAAAKKRWNPQVESMEGAAFMYACLVHHVPFAQVRAVSNVVERRNRAAWKMTEAVDNVCRAGFDILESV